MVDQYYVLLENDYHSEEINIYLNIGELKKESMHRRTGNFRPRGAVDHLPKKFLQIAQIFTKQSKRNKGHTMQQHRPAYWHTKVPQYRFSGSIYNRQV